MSIKDVSYPVVLKIQNRYIHTKNVETIYPRTKDNSIQVSMVSGDQYTFTFERDWQMLEVKEKLVATINYNK